MYVVTRDELYLVPTAEVPVTNLHRDEILDAAELPIRYAAYTPCFRREAGAAGKETRGILRVHQFDKVEMVLFERRRTHRRARVDDRARRDPPPATGLAYRVLLMSTREMGFVQAKKYDLEVWSPGVERWLEVSSCSNFRDYQARRMKAGVKRGAGSTSKGTGHGRPEGRPVAASATSTPRARGGSPTRCVPTSAATHSRLAADPATATIADPADRRGDARSPGWSVRAGRSARLVERPATKAA